VPFYIIAQIIKFDIGPSNIVGVKNLWGLFSPQKII